jgi:Chlorophyllase
MGETPAVFQLVEKPGLHSVGLRVEERYDRSRSFRPLTDAQGRPTEGNRERPLQTLIWYPAQSTPSAPMTVRDYGQLWATETSFGTPRLPARAKEWFAATHRALAMPTWAVLDAPAAAGRFPVVIYAPSLSSVAWENADLCEYWASHGFVVVATPNMGASTRNMTADLEGVNAQAADIAFLLGFAHALANADPSAVAVAGFSWGGLANLFAAARDNRIGALLCLDGSLRYWPGLVRQAGDVQPQRMSIPLASFAKSEWTLEEKDRYFSAAQIDGPNVLNAWTHGDLLSVHMLGMTHRQFSSMAQRNEDVWRDSADPEFPDRQRADYGREDAVAGYSWMARYTLAFLNVYLKQDSSERAYLGRSPAENGVPKHVMDVTWRPGRGIPASIAALRSEVGRQGFDRLDDICAAMSTSNSDVCFEESSLDDWAEELLDDHCLNEALALLTFNVRTHPDSSGAHTRLGRAQALAGQKADAIESYRTALQLSGVNAEARRELAGLEREAGTGESP